MPEHVTKERLALMGAPELVYIRAVPAKEILEFLDETESKLPAGVHIGPDAIWYAVHAADGSRLAVLDDRDAAFAAARGHELTPVSVH